MRSRVARFAIRALIAAAAVACIAPVAALLTLQNGRIARWAATRLLVLADPYPDRPVTVGAVRGSWWRSLTLIDVRLAPADSTPSVTLDTLRVRYTSLLHLARTRTVDAVDVAGLSVATRQRADGQWDLIAPFAHSDSSAATTTAPAAAQPLVIARLAVRRASLTAFPHPPVGAGTAQPLRVTGLALGAHGIRLGTAPAVHLDTLGAHVALPGPAAPPIDVAAAADLDDGRLTVRHLTAVAGTSRVAARGSLRLPDAAHPTLRDVDLTADAQPLRFADLTTIVPGLAARESAVVHVEARGTGSAVGIAATVALGRGGRITLDGTVTPGVVNVADTVRLRLHDVDPRTVLAAGAAGEVSGTLTAALGGPTLREASGTAVLDLSPAVRYGAWTARGVTARARLERGLVHVALQGATQPWRVAATATLAPFDSARPIDARIRVATVGAHPAALDTATVAVSLRGQRLRFAAGAGVGGGTVRATGDVQLGTPAAWRVTAGTFADVDLARVLGDTGATDGSLTGTFTAAGRGTTPAAMTASARVDLAPSRYGAVHLRRASAALAMRAGTAQLRTAIRLDSGVVTADATMTPFGKQPALVIHQIVLAHVDARSIAGDSAVATDLNGRLSGDATWTAGAHIAPAVRARARLVLLGSRVGTQQIDSGSVHVVVRHGLASWSGDAGLPHGTVTLAGTARPFDVAPSFRIREGTFTALDLGTLTGAPNAHTNLNGTLEATVQGTDPATARWAATLALAASTVRDVRLDSIRLTATLDSGRVHAAAAVHAPDGRGSGSVDGRLGVAEADTLSLRRVLAAADVHATATATWELAVPAPDTSIMLTAADSAPTRPDSLVAAAHLAGGRVTLDTLAVHSVLGTLAGSGSAALTPPSPGAPAPPSNLRLVLTTGNLAPLAPLLGEPGLAADSGQIVATVTGTAAAPRLETTARLHGLTDRTSRVDALEADVAASLTTGRTLHDATATIHATDAELRGIHAAQLDLSTVYDSSAAQLTAVTTLDDGTAAHLVLTASPDSLRHTVTLDSLGIERGRYRWALTHPVRLGYGDRYTVGDFVLVSNTGRRVAIDGAVGRSGAEQLSMELDSIALAPFARAFGYHALARARLDARATLGGTAAAPQLHADATVVLAGARADSGTMHAAVDWTASRLNLTAALTPRDGHALTAAGYLPVQLVLAPNAAGKTVSVDADGAVDLRLAANDFDLQVIEPFLDPETIDRARGTLTATARVSGRADAPRVDGAIALRDLLLRLPTMGVTYERGTVRAELAEDRLRIDTAVVFSGGGSLRLTGGVVLSQLTLGQFDVQAALQNFRAVWSDAYQVIASGTLAFSGTTRAPKLTGALQIDNGTLDISAAGAGGSAQPVTLTEAQMEMLEARFGHDAVRSGATAATPFIDLLALDLKVTADRDAWVRRRANPQLQLELGGTVEVRKDAHGPLRLYGTLSPIEGRSYVAQFGRRFTVQDGDLTFNGAPARVRMDIKTQYAVPSSGDPNAAEVTIGLEVSGTPQRMRLILSSDPQMNNSDIISYIATGRPEGEGLGIGGGGGSSDLAMQAGTSLALSQLQNVVQGLAKDKLQLDVMEIRQDGLRGATLVAGRYVSSRVYVGFAQPLGFGEATADPLNQNLYPEAQVEYGAFRWLLLRLEGGVSDLRFLLRSRYAY